MHAAGVTESNVCLLGHKERHAAVSQGDACAAQVTGTDRLGQRGTDVCRLGYRETDVCGSGHRETRAAGSQGDVCAAQVTGDAFLRVTGRQTCEAQVTRRCVSLRSQKIRHASLRSQGE